ncbi:inorganic pyrophosphatase isoform X2 [Anopheles moucheti]|uniref:inorganic pyrophosphatase isoform X2 n=1 Tax=Anopheles moucheti TaxID=186751 RepID=UPI0022F041B5|nr:inorganic pyrophosphatase isoform X2 [Anopheles moucheti]
MQPIVCWWRYVRRASFASTSAPFPATAHLSHKRSFLANSTSTRCHSSFFAATGVQRFCGAHLSSVSSNINILRPVSVSRFKHSVREFANNTPTMTASKYQIAERGAPNSTDYRVYFKNENGQSISPLHDIPLYANDEHTVYNMVVEVPRWTNAKMEISLGEGLNPIKQDVKKGKLRFVANCFPHHGYIWNYGAFPQTWENPDHLDADTGCKGDNDPIDVLEIGSRIAKRGEVMQVKILGTIALIDEGETDWKIITINVNDPVADQLNDIADVETVFPGLLRASVEWFKIYKIPDGKPENQFAFNGEAKDAAFATKTVADTHRFWQQLVNKEVDNNGISCLNTTVDGSPYLVANDAADEVFVKSATGGNPEPASEALGKWHYISLN